jgi:hypothetical protein
MIGGVDNKEANFSTLLAPVVSPVSGLGYFLSCTMWTTQMWMAVFARWNLSLALSKAH